VVFFLPSCDVKIKRPFFIPRTLLKLKPNQIYGCIPNVRVFLFALRDDTILIIIAQRPSIPSIEPNRYDNCGPKTLYRIENYKALGPPFSRHDDGFRVPPPHEPAGLKPIFRVCHNPERSVQLRSSYNARAIHAVLYPVRPIILFLFTNSPDDDLFGAL